MKLLDVCNNLDGCQGCHAVGKSLPKNVHIVWFHLLSFLKWQNYSNSEQTRGCHELGLGDGSKGVI